MRLIALLWFALGLGFLCVAAYTGEPSWRLGLYSSIGSFTLAGLALLAALGERLWPEQVPGVRGSLGVLAAAAAVGASRLRPLGSLPEQPLSHLGELGLSLGGLALCLGGGALALLALRSRSRLANSLAGLALLLIVLALGPWLGRLS